ncbi:hypothetical protein [Beijerinckia sp. L45]|uniref:hypothetical protein n=1 Tax=Beijerinckia sp. L45 TaxID=1641855 RepID=UPI00131E42EC|nr:hypothetical protein [Beijerinckia sp. L45]
MQRHYPLNPSTGVEDTTAVWTNGTPATGTQGSFPPYQLCTNPQDEILNVIAAAGITPSDADLSQLYEAIDHLIAVAIATVQIPTFSAGEGVKDVSNVFSLNYPGLAEEDTINANDLISFYAQESEGGAAADHHYRTTMSNIATWIANYISTIPTTPVFAPLATPDSWGNWTLAAEQNINDYVNTICPVSGPPTSWGSVSAGIITVSKSGLYQVNSYVSLFVSSNSNEASYFSSSIWVNGNAVNAQSSYGNEDFYLGTSISTSTVAYVEAGGTIYMTGLSHAGSYDETSNGFSVPCTLSIGKIN